jgi:hypothetical protein
MEVFYVGIGSSRGYSRANDTHGRSDYWKRIYNKVGRKVEILKNNISWEEACELEVLFIKTYGRSDLGTGPLVNMTDGGEGTLNVVKTEEQIEKWKTSNKGKQDGDKNTMFGKTYDKHHRSRKVINFKTGDVYGCAKIVSEVNSIPYSTFKSKLQNKLYNNTDYIYLTDYFEGYKPPLKESKYIIIHLETGIAYENMKEAARAYGISHQTLEYALKRKVNNTTGLCYIENYSVAPTPKKVKKNESCIIDTQTGIIYYSLREASNGTGITYSTLKNARTKERKTGMPWRFTNI